MHYLRKWHNLPMDKIQKTVEQRIMEKVEKKENGCWIWTGAKSGGNGREEYKYGYITIDYKQKRVHRVLYELTYGVKLGDKILLHKCDNPLCVNPKHMQPGTINDNNQDAIRKGRVRHPKGEDNHSKLTEKQVEEIRMLNDEFGYSNRELGEEFGVHAVTIYNIILRKKWKHI